MGKGLGSCHRTLQCMSMQLHLEFDAEMCLKFEVIVRIATNTERLVSGLNITSVNTLK